MAADDPLILDLAAAILDGEDPDWPSLESSASDSQREAFAELQAVAAIGSLCRRKPRLLHQDLVDGGMRSWGQLRRLEHIGRGGFGLVYRAWDPQLDREVALKLLPADENALRALAEGRLLAKVHHRNVVTIFGADQFDSHVGLWMEFVRGDTLEQILAREGPLAPARVAAIGLQLCEALTAVHRAGLVHRDVKAQNVMLEPGGRLVLMDFGAGRILASETQDVAGTPLYLAPEIFSGGTASERGDIYSVGVLLYHLLTAQYPVAGRTLRDVRDAHRRGSVVAIRNARVDVPRRLAATIERALAVDPNERFSSADAMAHALAAAASPRIRIMHAAAVVALLVAAGVAGLATGVIPGLSGTGSSPTPATAVPADTPSARQLSLPDAQLWGSGLSSDGRYFSFLNDSGLAVFDMATGQPETLVAHQADQFAEYSITSPDGKWIAYQWWTDRESVEVRVVNRLTKQVRVLLRDDTLDYPLPVEWSRDGRSILLWIKPLRGANQIVLADADTGALHVVRDLPMNEPLGMSLSPDGRYVAYDLPAAVGDPARVLHIADTSSGVDTVLPTERDANDRFPLWTPDGRGVFFISDRSGASDGWLVPVHDGVASAEPALVVRNLGRVSSLGLTSSGAFYYRLRAGAFEVAEIAIDLNTMAFLSRPKRVPTRFTASNIAPSYSPDGQRMAYVSVREALGGKPARTVVIKDLISGDEREINPRVVGNSPLRWSPDGARLLQASRVIDAQTGESVHEFNEHADKDATAYGPTRWGPDGKSVLYERERKGLVRHPLDGGAETLVYEYSPKSPVSRIHRFEVSPNGQAIVFSAFLRDRTGTIMQVITPTGSVELARRQQPEMLVVQGWSPDSNYVVFTTARTNAPPPHDLWRVPVWGGAPEHLGKINGGTQINPMAISPLGSALAYTSGSPLQELWMMEHFLPQ